MAAAGVRLPGQEPLPQGYWVPAPMQRLPSPHPRALNRGEGQMVEGELSPRVEKKGSVRVGGCPLEQESEVRGTRPWHCTHSSAAQLAM